MKNFEYIIIGNNRSTGFSLQYDNDKSIVAATDTAGARA
jgi:hypothetical protein